MSKRFEHIYYVEKRYIKCSPLLSLLHKHNNCVRSLISNHQYVTYNITFSEEWDTDVNITKSTDYLEMFWYILKVALLCGISRAKFLTLKLKLTKIFRDVIVITLKCSNSADDITDMLKWQHYDHFIVNQWKIGITFFRM